MITKISHLCPLQFILQPATSDLSKAKSYHVTPQLEMFNAFPLPLCNVQTLNTAYEAL